MEHILKSKFISLCLIIILVIGCLPFVIDIGSEHSTVTGVTTRYVGVGQTYTTIGAAITAANPGDTIRVYAGTYNEKITINKKITLIGNGTTNTTINGGGNGDVVTITSNNVNISGFTVTNSGYVHPIEGGIVLKNVNNCRIINNNCSSNKRHGIYLYQSYYNRIENNSMSFNDKHGITLISSDYNVVVNNTFVSNFYSGIRFHESYKNIIFNNSMFFCGIHFYGTQLKYWNSHTISTNNTVNNRTLYYLINLDGWTIPPNAGQIILVNCNNILIENQNLSDGSDGISLGWSKNIIMKNNTINSNKRRGVFLYASQNNIIKNNTFQSNIDVLHLTRYSNINVIENNTFFDNFVGIRKEGYSSFNKIFNCSFNSNEYAIMLDQDCDYNEIINNTFIFNDRAIYLAYSDNNRFVNNSLLNNSKGIMIRYTSLNLNFFNTTNINSTEFDIQIDGKSNMNLINCSFNWSNIEFNDIYSTITIKWFMHIKIINKTRKSIEDAYGTVKNNESNVIYSGFTNDNGYIKWIECIEYIEDKSGINKILTPYNISIEKEAYETNYAYPEPDMNKSKTITIILYPDITPPLSPSNLTFNITGGTFLNFSWSQLNVSDVYGYNIYLNDTGSTSNFHYIGSTQNLFYNITNLLEETNYHIKVTSFDDVPLESIPLLGNITTKDITPPDKPKNLIYSGIGATFLNISWIKSKSLDVLGYEIYINNTGSKTNFHLLDITNNNYYNYTNLNEEITYYFKVRAFDEMPLYSNFSNTLQVTTLDITPPLSATLLTCSNIGGYYINISWTSSISKDVLGYQIFINNTDSSTNFHLLSTTPNLFYNSTGLIEETTYYFKIRAFDEVPLFSIFSNIVSGITLDITPPDPPKSLIITKIGGDFINLIWSDSTSSDVEGYQIYINDTDSSVNYHFLTDSTNCFFNHTGLPEEIKFYYKIRAYDEVPLHSLFSNTAWAITLDISPPNPPSNLVAKNSTGNNVTLEWDANSESDLMGYNIFINESGAGSNGPFICIQTIIGNVNYYIITGLVEETTYYFVITAFDEVPNNSSFSNLASILTLDETPPAVPLGLNATVISGTKIKLTWEPNTEEDISGYYIYLNETDNGSIGKFELIHSIFGTETSYIVSNLNEEVTYYFKIKAFDEIPNNSSFSNVVSATTPDETPPSAPTGLKILSRTHDSLTLSWSPDPESDVIGYFIYRSIKKDESVKLLNSMHLNETKYTDIDLNELTTYYYRITAIDEVNLKSDFSQIINGTTLLGPYPPEINNTITRLEISEDSYDDESINLYYIFKDPNYDLLTFWCKGQEFIEVTIYQTNGTVVLQPDHNWNGEEDIIFFASDGINDINVNLKITIAVTPINDPPQTVKIINPDDKIKVKDGTMLEFNAICDDPDIPYGDKLTYTWISNISGEIGEGDSLLNIYLPIGTHLITSTVSDIAGEMSLTNIEITILETPASDSDNDGMPNIWERKYKLDLFNPKDADSDTDNDGLSNTEEFYIGTNPLESDSDNDGLSDGDEINKFNTNATNPDSDFDGYYDDVDDYPLDSTQWKKEKEIKKEINLISVWTIIIITILVILILLIYLKKIKKKMYNETTSQIKNEKIGLPSTRKQDFSKHQQSDQSPANKQSSQQQKTQIHIESQIPCSIPIHEQQIPEQPVQQPQQQTEIQTVPCPICQKPIAVYSSPCPHCKTNLNW